MKNIMKTNLLFLASVALLFTVGDAQAQAQAQVWSMANKAGGRIILVDRPCPDQDQGAGLLEAYAYTADGTRTAGCWTFFDGLVQIGWGQGKRSVFPQERFIPEATTSPPARRPAKPL